MLSYGGGFVLYENKGLCSEKEDGMFFLVKCQDFFLWLKESKTWLLQVGGKKEKENDHGPRDEALLSPVHRSETFPFLILLII